MSKLRPYLADIASAIREKKGSSEPINAKDFSNEIRSIQSGGGEVVEVEEKDVNFYDYDGTLLYAYTLDEAHALTELPTPKGHEGLIFQGWNWDYEDVIALDYPMDIGAMYVTDDGATRIYIKIDNERAKEIDLQLYINANSRVSIDWGDGTTETTSKEYTINVPHTYENLGEYVIRLQAVAGTYSLNASTKALFVGALSGHPERQDIVQKVEFGSNLRPSVSYTFQYCFQLKSVSIPLDLNQIGANAFAKTSKLKMVVIPKGTTTIVSNVFNFCSAKIVSLPKSITSIGATAFQEANVKKICLPPNLTAIGNQCFQTARVEKVFLPKNFTSIPNQGFHQCRYLREIEIQEGLTSVGNYGIGDCEVLSKVVFPQSVSSLGSYACYTLTNVSYFDFSKCTAIPTLAAANSFGNLHADTKIIVPDALYDQWVIATNWTTHKDRIVKNSEYVRPL
jgi:hypothetical protein